MRDDEPAENSLDRSDTDTDDEFERTPLPLPAARRSLRGYQRPRRRRRRHFWAIPAGAVIIVTLLLVITGSAVANTQPVQINAGPWLRVPLQAHDGRAVHSFAPSPDDPNTLFVCVGPIIGSAYPAAIGPIWLFRTRDLGAHWQQLALPPLAGASCSVGVAGDAPQRVTLSVEAWTPQSKQMPACADITLYLSDDGGDTWRALPHPTVGPDPNQYTSCLLWGWATDDALFLLAYSYGVNSGTAAQSTTIERSDDGGRTWLPADNGLPRDGFVYRFLQGGPIGSIARPGDTMVATIMRWSATSGAPKQSYDVWRTTDAGRSWQQVSTVRFPGGSNRVIAPEQQPYYIVSGDQVPADMFPIRILQLDHLFHQQGRVPPLPVPGSAPDRTGIVQVIGTTLDGRIFALGIDPQRGVPAQPSPFSSDNPSYQAFAQALTVQWVWIWSPRLVRWAVVMSPLHVAEHAHYGCGNCWQWYLTRGTDLDAQGQKATGTYVWLRDWKGTESAAYRLFVPDTSA